MANDEIIYRNTFHILEHLLNEIPSLMTVMQELDVIGPKRPISPIKHPELSGILCDFDHEMKIIVTNSILQTICLVEPKKISRRFPVIYINGSCCRVERHSASLIVSELTDSINQKEFFPEPFCRSIAYIDQWQNSVQGLILYECWNGVWTAGDIYELPNDKMAKTGPGPIIKQIMGEITDREQELREERSHADQTE